MTTKLILRLMAICLFVVSCKHEEKHKYHTVVDKIVAETIESENTTLTSEIYNEGIKTVTVNEDGYDFLIPERKSQIASYNCTECHTEPIENLKQHQLDEKAAHWNIKLVHASAETMNCATCHTSSDMDNLHSLTNSTIDFNYSYKVCSQCHQQEFKDWKGGAHGKQLGGWAPPRLSKTCVNCHNPHQPAFEKRWPVRFNTQKVKERK
ncbi:Cytochrome c7 [Lutibacter agarilyticus]|uniref:Cytochrome c7 n=1 Tax=Lutibacter agarilyticus TaxID=1109740 RepID=A0A238Z2A0_9FLAO|nr:cytochrome c3 family protein [Lutibacter agarilyticus]SNR77507.1 Cytochrome c7 [Lutibacter agarilyticus]